MGKGATSEPGKKKNIQNRKFHYNFYDTVTALRAKLFVAKLMINQSLQGVGAGVEIENFYIVKFIYSEKATKFCEISTNYLTGST